MMECISLLPGYVSLVRGHNCTKRRSAHLCFAGPPEHPSSQQQAFPVSPSLSHSFPALCSSLSNEQSRLSPWEAHAVFTASGRHREEHTHAVLAARTLPLQLFHSVLGHTRCSSVRIFCSPWRCREAAAAVGRKVPG